VRVTSLSRDLRPLFDPRSVAVLGASNDPSKWGNRLAMGALRGEKRRSVYLVNRNGGEILDRPAYARLADLPEAPELVVVSVPAEGFEQAVDASLAAGAKALVGITTGLGETGPEGQAREAAIVDRVRAAGAVLLGPNCLGVFDAATELDLGWSELQGGSIALVSQSGNLALELALLAEDYGLGFSRFASLGNQADLEAGELVRSLVDHEQTRVIALYCEDFRDGRGFAQAAQEAVEAGKAVILLTVGASDVSAQAARSHTGALVSDATAVEAACRAAGMQRVRSPRQLIDLAQAELARHRPRGRRVAIVGDGGGHGIVASDVATAEGLELPVLSPDLQARIALQLPDAAPTRNPVDFAGAGEQFMTIFEDVTRIVLESGEVDAELLTGYFGGYSEFSPEFEAQETEVALGMARAADENGRALVIQSMYPRSPALVALREAGVPVYREIEAASWALARLANQAERAPRGVPELPPPTDGPPADDYWGARELLASAGIEFPPARRVAGVEEARAAAAELAYPVVVKALGLVHKSDAGGVALGIGDDEALEATLAKMATLQAETYSVERMAPITEGAELIAGCLDDPRFGPIVLVGLGGIHAEFLDDTAVALAPIDSEGAEELIRSLHGAPIFAGARGRPPLDVAAAAEAVAALSRLAASRLDLAEVEVNPLLVLPAGALALDARAVSVENGADAR
jgi:acyl-CoA synthetase (NDP forming)